MGESKEGGFYDELSEYLSDESKVMIQEYVELWLQEFEGYSPGARSLFLNGRLGRKLAEHILENLMTKGADNHNLDLFNDDFAEDPNYNFVDNYLSVDEVHNAVQDALLLFSSTFQRFQAAVEEEARQIEESDRPVANPPPAKRRRVGLQIGLSTHLGQPRLF